MRKYFILLLLSAAARQVTAQAQAIRWDYFSVRERTAVIQAQQYRLIVNRTVKKWEPDFGGFQWQLMYFNPNIKPCQPQPDCEGGAVKVVRTHAEQEGATPGTCTSKWSCKVALNTSPCANADKSVIQFFSNSSLLNYSTKVIYPNSQPVEVPVEYADTLDLYGASFNITSINSTLFYKDATAAPDPNNDGMFITNNCGDLSKSITFLPEGTYYDRIDTLNHFRYQVITRVRVVLNTDPILTLPSDDRVSVIQTYPTEYAIGSDDVIPARTYYYTYVPQWQYSLSPFDTWQDVADSLTHGTRGENIQVSGKDLFGEDYTDHLGDIVMFRVKGKENVLNSAPAPFVMRLSSPHITTVTPYNLNCFERPEGSLKIKFDRQLITGEKLNILLYDTLNRINYSALNLEQLDADSSYTWEPELTQGVYFISLIGKYATGATPDLYVSERDDTVRTYTALNTVNFEDGFITPEVDTFDAFTTYESFAYATYTGGIEHFQSQRLTQPTKIIVSIQVDSNVICKGTAAGVITVKIRGGKDYVDEKKYFKYSIQHQDSADFVPFVECVTQTPTYFYTGSGPLLQITEKIRGLVAGHYLLRIRDSVDCYAMDSVGEEMTYPFEITEPETGITLDELEISPITSTDSANAHFSLKVIGGTQYRTTVSGSETVYPEAYIAELRDSATNTLLREYTDYTDTTINNEYFMYSRRFGEGTYILRIFDKSYNASDPYNTGCFIELHFNFVKPNPLVVTLSQLKPIDCHDERNGELLATATGGIANDSTRYKFEWYRLTGEGNALLPGDDTLIFISDSTIRGLAAGNYVVKITDKYGNTAKDTFLLQQPALITIQDSVRDASCYSSSDGRMSITATGGTVFSDPLNPYRYEWSTGDFTRIVDSIPGGEYLVVVRDSMGCTARQVVEVTSPYKVVAQNTVTPVTCYNASDGAISLNVTGGHTSQPYQYTWSTGATTSSVSGLAPGTYWYTATDHMGCYDSDTISLVRPDTLFVNLGPDRKLCRGQIIRLNGTVTSTQETLAYSWQGNSSDSITWAGPRANITGSGTYILSVQNTTGCVIKDTIVVTFSGDTINTDFIVSTQAYKNESVILVSLSTPYPPDSLMWVIPQQGNMVRVVNQDDRDCELVFADTGRYEIMMKIYYHNGCIDDTIKYVNVIGRDNFGNVGNQANAYIKMYGLIVPNPSAGSFDVQLTASENTRATMRLVNILTNVTVDVRDINITVAPNVHTEHYNLPVVPSGMYALVVDTPRGSFVYKVMISR